MKAKFIFHALMALACVCLPTLIHAQISNPGPNPDRAPIDGGIGLLLAAGVGYGLKKARDLRKKKA